MEASTAINVITIMCASAMYIYASEVWLCDVGLVCRLNMCPPSSQRRYVLHSLYNPMYFHCMNIAQVYTCNAIWVSAEVTKKGKFTFCVFI